MVDLSQLNPRQKEAAKYIDLVGADSHGALVLEDHFSCLDCFSLLSLPIIPC